MKHRVAPNFNIPFKALKFWGYSAVFQVALIATPLSSALCQDSNPTNLNPKATYALASQTEPELQPISQYRGWDYLVEQLRIKGVSEQDIAAIYKSPSMPWFSFVPFKLKPKEASSIYAGFNADVHYQLGAQFIRSHAREFQRMEKALKVPREVVAAILVVESQVGKNTGDELVVYRLSRVASVGDPHNLRENFDRLKEDDLLVTFESVRNRARSLEDTFLPEIPALIEISKRNRVDPFEIRGSIAGAFGLPQFLPSAFLKYGIDGDRNGIVALHSEVDAIWSAGNYLGSYGFRDDLPLSEKRAIIWHYNKSDAYIDTILTVSKGISRALANKNYRSR